MRLAPEQLADRVKRARSVAHDRCVVDPYVLGLSDLAQLVADRLTAQDAMDDAAFSGVECDVAVHRLVVTDSMLRAAVGLPPARGFAGVARGPNPVAGGDALPVSYLLSEPRRSWLSRAWGWLSW